MPDPIIEGKLYRTGGSWAVTIPKALVDCGVYDPSKRYRVKLEEIEGDAPAGMYTLFENLQTVELPA